MKLKEIIKGIDCEVYGSVDVEVKDIQFDSRRVGEGTLFVAQRGTKVDGHDFIAQAVERGAVAVVFDSPLRPSGTSPVPGEEPATHRCSPPVKEETPVPGEEPTTHRCSPPVKEETPVPGEEPATHRCSPPVKEETPVPGEEPTTHRCSPPVKEETPVLGEEPTTYRCSPPVKEETPVPGEEPATHRCSPPVKGEYPAGGRGSREVCEAGDEAYVKVKDSSEALGLMAANFYGHPSEQLKLIGITGTNGKTTTVTLLHRMFRMLGHHVGLVSTIVNKIDEEELPTGHTTPDALELNQLLRRMVDAGCDYCFMEVSSHAVVQHRIAGVRFAGGIFSNITHDHLDFHKTMANYIAAKKGFFDALPKEAWALTNVDDKNGRVMVQNTKAKVYTYALQHQADFHSRVLEDTFEGMHLDINGKELWCRLVGRFNAYNLTAIYAAAVLSGAPEEEVLRLLSMLEAAPGRFQYVTGKGITGIVDYAHTPDALENVIGTVNAIRRKTQQLITVVGCGGDRDRTKRPEMAQIAAEGSDKVVLTSDNPRTENPDAILDEMEAGLTPQQLSHVVRITDRRQAIRTACMMAKEGDIVLVAGKGHEKYQEVNGVRSHFDDVEELEIVLGSPRNCKP